MYLRYAKGKIMKIARHAKILELIGKYDIERQEDLASRLDEAGFQVTQATVSRDIRQLKLTKVMTLEGKAKYALSQTPDSEYSKRYVRVLSDALISIDIAENILVIKTVSGMAMAAAAALDELNFSEIVGCIAGDNTIMCAIRSKKEAFVVMEKLQRTIGSFQ